jgi:phenol/toluene 2-monooxygenase (NADH) P1/A1
MPYELRYQVIEPKRQTYQNLIDRFGDQPASRYLEATMDVEPRENFRYRPTWTQDRELYDPRYCALRLADPYQFTDPRQFYYTPYVSSRAALHDDFSKTLGCIEERDLLARLPAGWRALLAAVVVPLRHYESGAQLISVAGARFAYGTSLEQCCTFAAFDRIGNAQLLSRIGIALGGGMAAELTTAKAEWLDGTHLQPLRRLTEQIMVTEDWAEGMLAVDFVDSVLYPLLYQRLDQRAAPGDGGAYSLLARSFSSWFADQRRWVDALTAAWRDDPVHGTANRAELDRIEATWRGPAEAAVAELADAAEASLEVTGR